MVSLGVFDQRRQSAVSKLPSYKLLDALVDKEGQLTSQGSIGFSLRKTRAPRKSLQGRLGPVLLAIPDTPPRRLGGQERANSERDGPNPLYSEWNLIPIVYFPSATLYPAAATLRQLAQSAGPKSEVG